MHTKFVIHTMPSTLTYQLNPDLSIDHSTLFCNFVVLLPLILPIMSLTCCAKSNRPTPFTKKVTPTNSADSTNNEGTDTETKQTETIIRKETREKNKDTTHNNPSDTVPPTEEKSETFKKPEENTNKNKHHQKEKETRPRNTVMLVVRPKQRHSPKHLPPTNREGYHFAPTSDKHHPHHHHPHHRDGSSHQSHHSSRRNKSKHHKDKHKLHLQPHKPPPSAKAQPTDRAKPIEPTLEIVPMPVNKLDPLTLEGDRNKITQIQMGMRVAQDDPVYDTLGAFNISWDSASTTPNEKNFEPTYDNQSTSSSPPDGKHKIQSRSRSNESSDSVNVTNGGSPNDDSTQSRPVDSEFVSYRIDPGDLDKEKISDRTDKSLSVSYKPAKKPKRKII